jgi:hypothetical protein
MKIQNIEHLVSSFREELRRERARNWQSAEAQIETKGYQAALEWAIILASELLPGAGNDNTIAGVDFSENLESLKRISKKLDDINKI